MKRKYLGFTLVELLVVVSIISILAGVLYVNFRDVRETSRDKVRKNTLIQMQLAIELYKSQYGEYPEPGCGVNDYGSTQPVWAGSETYSSSATWLRSCPDDYIMGLAPDFISELPSEIGNATYNKGYVYASNGSAYKLLSHHNVEVSLVENHDDYYSRFMTTCPGAKGSVIPEGEKDVYAVYSAGAECW